MASNQCIPSWICNKCNVILGKMNARIKMVEDKVEKLELENSNNKKDIKDASDDRKGIHAKVDKLDKEIKSSAANLKHSVMAEVNSREERAKNVIVYGIKEPEEGTTNEKSAIDKEAISKVLHDLADESVVESVRRIARLGKPGPRARPILISFTKTETKDLIINLANTHRSKLGNISIRHDLTKHQQEHDKAARDEVDRKNAVVDDLHDDSGDFRWRVTGPPGALRIVKTRDLRTWESHQAKRASRASSRASPRISVSDQETDQQEQTAASNIRPPRKNSRRN